MGKTINTVLNLQDKFSDKLYKAGNNALSFKSTLLDCNIASNKIESSLNNLAKTATTAGATAAASIKMLYSKSMETYKGFQQSMSNMAGIMDINVNSQVFDKLENSAREAGKSTTKTAQEAADALSYMALAGWDSNKAIKGLTPILKASEATGQDLARTSDLITDSMSALGIEVDRLDHYLDVSAKTQNKSNTNLAQLQEAYIKCGGTFQSFGSSIEESSALLGILANRGIKGSEAGNSLQSTMINLTKKTGESAKAMEELGLSAYDKNGKFKGATVVLMELSEKTKKFTDEQRQNSLQMIGGKEQIQTLNALMNGLTTTLEDGTTEYKALYNSLLNADGALNRMAHTMTNNYAGASALAESATDDFKIAIGEKIEPYISQFLNWFSSEIPRVTELTSIWLDKKLPKAIDILKSSFEKIKPIIAFGIKHFESLATSGLAVVSGLKAFTIMSKVQTYASKLTSSVEGLAGKQKILTLAQTALNTSLLACPITWISAGIATVTGLTIAWNRSMEKANIKKHFGDIALTAEQCDLMVKNAFGRETIERANEVSNAYAQVEKSIDDINNVAGTLNRIRFNIEYGGEFDAYDYIETVQDYISSFQQGIDNDKYSAKLDIELLLDDSDYTEDFFAMYSNSLNGMLEESKKVGDELSNYYKKCMDEGLVVDPNHVTEQLKRVQKIKDDWEISKSNAAIEAANYDFLNSDFSVESFETYVNKIISERDKLENVHDTARINSIARLGQSVGFESEEYKKGAELFNQAYTSNALDIDAKTLEVFNGTIMSAYDDVYKAINSEYQNQFNDNNFLRDYWKSLDEAIANGGPLDFIQLNDSMETHLNNSFNSVEVDDAARKHIGELYERILPTVNTMRMRMNAVSEVKNISKEYADVFLQSNIIGASGKNAESLKVLTMNTLSNVLPADKAKILQSFSKMGKYCVKGITSEENKKEIESASNELRTHFTNMMSKPLKIDVPIKISATGSLPSSNNNSPQSIDSNATGTHYFGGGFTSINEHGGEIIDLPTGSRIIPADKSEKMLDQKPSINVNINVNGSIFGTEEAVDIIGSEVCNKIVALVGAM